MPHLPSQTTQNPIFGRENAARQALSPWREPLLALLRRLNHRRKTRRTLARLPEHLLQDIGLSRHEAETECAKPFWRD